MTPVKILFVAADPYSRDPNLHPGEWDPRLALDEDHRAILQKVRAAEHRDALHFVPRLAARPDDLLQAMNEVRPDAVHFSGHGGSGGVVLVGEDGGPHPVDAKALAMLFRAAGEGVRLVVLSACKSDGVAQVLAQVVGCAVGMHGEMPDDSALAFNASFYRAIAFGRSVRDAFEQGRTAVALEGLDGQERPRLFSALGVDPATLMLVNGSDARQEPRPAAPSQVFHVVGHNNRINASLGDMHIGTDDAPPRGDDGVQRFTNVWYLPRRLRFYQPVNADVGTLIVYPDHVEFRGEKGGSVNVGEIHDVAHTRHGGDISNSWVRVTYGDRAAPQEAYFSHRTRLGVDALLGGSHELFEVLHARVKPPVR